MSLISSILELCQASNTGEAGGLIVDIHAVQEGPIRVRMPMGWRGTNVTMVPVESMEEVMTALDREWKETLKVRGSVSKTITLSDGRLRCTGYREKGGTRLAVVVRRVPKEPLPLEKIGLPVTVMQVIAQMRGLILIAGQTGAGKTTSIASLLSYINKACRNHIVTIEDPIEYEFQEEKSIITQREVPLDVPSFADGIRDAMRQSPDVIFVSEIRDADTAETVLRAAESGHLVLATLHASSALGAIQKLLSWFPADQWEGRRHTIANNLLMAIYQTLVPTADGKQFAMAAEILANHHQQMTQNLLDPNRWGAVTEYAKRNTDKVSKMLNASLLELVVKKEISAAAAMQATNNRLELRERLEQAGIR